MKILLLLPPTNLSSSYGSLSDFSNPQPSIGVAYIASVLRENNHNVKVIDAYVLQYNIEQIKSEIKNFSPDIVGLSVLTSSAEVVYVISKEIRSMLPKVKIVMGNIHASIFSDEVLKNSYADYVIHREGEISFLNLVNAIKSEHSIKNVNGISYIKNGEVINNKVEGHIEDLDALPFPAWDLFPMEKYTCDPRTEIIKGHSEFQIISSRGCPNQCTFCSSRTERSLGHKYRMRTPALVVDEMEYMHQKYGALVFSFMDLAFPLVKNHAYTLCEEIIKRNLHKKIKWSTECRVKPLDQDMLDIMKKSGCQRINFGIESGNNETLRDLKKNFTTDDVEKAVKMAHKSRIEIDGMFMMGLPGETEEKIMETIKFAIKLNIRYAIFNIFVPYPGCELWDTLNLNNKIHYNNWSEFTSYPTYSGGKPVYVPDSLSYEKLMKLQSLAMKKFYFRPKFILNELKHFKFDKIHYYINGLKGILSK